MTDHVILVDVDDRELGIAPKVDAHEAPGRLHRAISVFVYDTAGLMVLQRRMLAKYHFAGLWGNTACSHPQRGESAVDAGVRRLHEEMGLQTHLEQVGSFIYRAEDPISGLVEHEFDHVLVGVTDHEPRPHPDEADDWDRVHPQELWQRLAGDHSGFVPWLRSAMEAIPSLRAAPAL
ncbi:MAG: isopentenyl-diphosphate Delta-isomerase [Acidimicrobiia bacterium]|nr:isopentenyl-diphosphate Delta-isomerase [Acidimicrobiia bacterium]